MGWGCPTVFESAFAIVIISSFVVIVHCQMHLARFVVMTLFVAQTERRLKSFTNLCAQYTLHLGEALSPGGVNRGVIDNLGWGGGQQAQFGGPPDGLKTVVYV